MCKLLIDKALPSRCLARHRIRPARRRLRAIFTDRESTAHPPSLRRNQEDAQRQVEIAFRALMRRTTLHAASSFDYIRPKRWRAHFARRVATLGDPRAEPQVMFFPSHKLYFPSRDSNGAVVLAPERCAKDRAHSTLASSAAEMPLPSRKSPRGRSAIVIVDPFPQGVFYETKALDGQRVVRRPRSESSRWARTPTPCCRSLRSPWARRT